VVAKNRGVSVEVILDRGQPKARGGMFGFFVDQGVPLWIDTCCAIAHNKVIIIDGERVLTGSYNFTEAARKRNAENLLLLRDPVLARTYLDNWQMHKAGAQRHAAR
jgi:phosphatidylserine/phosphatidylglycerophosphate/cardiolipin synthase-like enzyme